jgi:hypothetical protein
MLVTVLVWAYARGVASSRDIEGLCRTDVAFRVICGRIFPDFSTICRFQSAFPGTIGEFFAQEDALTDQLPVTVPVSQSGRHRTDLVDHLAAAHLAGAQADHDHAAAHVRQGCDILASSAADLGWSSW